MEDDKFGAMEPELLERMHAWWSAEGMAKVLDEIATIRVAELLT